MKCSTRLPGLAISLITMIFATTGVAHAQEEDAQAVTPTVGVIELQAHPIPVVSELPGRIAATRVSEVRARVSGILKDRVFEQGSQVKQGDVLYRIDPRLFEVRVHSAEATLQRAVATQANARQQLERQKALRARNVATGVDYDSAAVAVAQADADVALAEAALEEAKINLDYTVVRAPITGIIGAALATEGSLVTADGTSNLALIQQIDPVYADFTQSAQDLLALKRAVSEGKLQSPAPGQARVELVFDGGQVYPHAGRLLFSNASVDANTGQVTLRAEFPNAGGDLLPGMYVRVRIEQAVQNGGITIPQRSVIRDTEGKPQVYVLGKDGSAQIRDISTGQAVGSEWVVRSGLKAGETVIVEGIQKVQPGGAVKVEPWTAAGSPNSVRKAAE